MEKLQAEHFDDIRVVPLLSADMLVLINIDLTLPWKSDAKSKSLL